MGRQHIALKDNISRKPEQDKVIQHNESQRLYIIKDSAGSKTWSRCRRLRSMEKENIDIQKGDTDLMCGQATALLS